MTNSNHKFEVLVLGNIRSEGLDVLAEFANVKKLPEPVATSDILECVEGMDAILHKVGKVGGDVINRQKKIQIIARHGVGLDDLDLPIIEAAGIPVSTTLTANTNAVAEATIGLALSLLRHLNSGEAMIKRERKWSRETLMGQEIRNSTVGIIGFGRIGRLVAQYYAVFGANIIVYDSYPDAIKGSGYEATSLNDLLARADIVSLHCPLMPETQNLIDAECLSIMKDSAILVNTSRGRLVDKNALAAAAQSGMIRGAAIDVFDVEPPDFNDALFACDNILTTPHIAAMTVQAQTAMAVGAAEEIRRVLIDNVKPSNSVFGG
jgi:D-3-phosphoglycerate dehydrogenase / 2-oxoglutarate reductase